MPVMNEQVRKERTEKLIQLLAEGMSPADAWRVVDPKSKAKGKSAADQTRRDIGWYRERYCVTDSSAGPNGSNGAASLNGAHAEVTEDVAAKPTRPTKPVKRCLGVEDKPCEKEITGRSPRCDECRKEHTRLRRQGENRNDHRRHGERRKEEEKERQAAERRRLQEEQEEQERQAAELRRKEEEKRRRRQEIEKLRQGIKELRAVMDEREARQQEAEARRKAEEERIEAERKAEEDRIAKLPKVRMLDDGRSITEYHDGRREIHDLRTGRTITLQPGEPIPPPRGPKFFDADLPASPAPTSYYQDWVVNHRRR